MEILFKICGGMSIGIVIGFLVGGIKMKLSRKSYSEKQIEFNKKCIKKVAGGLKYLTFAVLSIGFIWCVYFLVLGTVKPQQADYANSMAGLIVSVLTVISIIFAFVEFLRRTDGKE